MKALPEPHFIDRDPEVIKTELIQLYEQATGKTLQPAQVERILVEIIAYRETLIRIAIQEAAKQNLVRYAGFPMLDYLGELLGIERLEPQFARTTLKATLTAAQGTNVVIPAGTRVETKDGRHVFKTEAALTIAAGQTTGNVAAVAQVEGIEANGYLPGEVATVLDPVAWVASIVNTTTTDGGSGLEENDRYRERIMLAPEAFSTAGAKGAYRFHAMAAHPSIVDVAIQRGANGEVLVYPLTELGDPSPEIISQVEAALSAEDKRPLTDLVNVQAPARIDFAIVANLTLYTTADQSFVLSTAHARLEDFNSKLKAGLGRDIVPSQIVGVIAQVEGVYMVDLVSPVFQEVAENAYANCTEVTLNVVGVTNG